MQAADGERYLDGLRSAEAHLEATRVQRDVDGIWQALHNCLGWLYRSEERERAARSDYYMVRSARLTVRRSLD